MEIKILSEEEKRKRLKRWSLIGFALGFIVPISRIMTSDGSAEAEDIGRFIGSLIGSPLGCAFWGAVLAVIVNKRSRSPTADWD